MRARARRSLVFGLALASAMACTSPLAAQTFVEDDIDRDTTWTADESPYIVTAFITVFEGATLTIEPGAVVRIAAGNLLMVGDPIITKSSGTLVAEGTEDEPILIGNFGGSGDEWGSVWITDRASPATFDQEGQYTGGTKFEHVIFERGGVPSEPFTEGLMSLDGPPPYLREVEFRDIDSVAINQTALATGVLRYDGGRVVGVEGGMRLEGGSEIDVRGVTFTDGTGRVVASGTPARFIDCRFVGGDSGRGGLLIENRTASIRGCEFESIRAGSLGALAIQGGTVQIFDCTFNDNRSTVSGAAINASGATVNVLSSEFVANSAVTAGGAIFVDGGDLLIVDSALTGNTARTGGAVAALSGSGRVEVARSELADSMAEGDGGAIVFDAERMDILNTVFTRNAGLSGGAVAVVGNGGVVVARDSEFVDNTAQDQGGAVVVELGSLFAATSVFTTNTAESGGALAVVGPEARVIVEICEFMANEADDLGGAVLGALSVTQSVVRENRAARGGGIAVSRIPTRVTRTEIVGNEAQDGGGVYVGIAGADLSGDPVRAEYNTVRDNIATRGAAIFNVVTTDPIDATYVCWGTNDTGRIAERIWDGEDDAGLSFVLFEPSARGCTAGCRADWDGNGLVNPADVGSFLSDYFLDLLNGTLVADFTGNGVVNANDVSAFLNAYFQAPFDPECEGM